MFALSTVSGRGSKRRSSLRTRLVVSQSSVGVRRVVVIPPSSRVLSFHPGRCGAATSLHSSIAPLRANRAIIPPRSTISQMSAGHPPRWNRCDAHGVVVNKGYRVSGRRTLRAKRLTVHRGNGSVTSRSFSVPYMRHIASLRWSRSPTRRDESTGSGLKMLRLFLGSLGVAILTVALVASLGAPAFAATAPNLGGAARFAVLGGTSVVNSGASTINGDVGVSPGSDISGFPPGVVTGSTHAGDLTAAQAQKDAAAAYNNAVAQACDTTLATSDLTGLTLGPGVHCLPAGAVLNGTLTLDAKGTAGAAFIFKVTGSLSTAGSSLVRLANGASHCNVYWVVSDFARIGALTNFRGNVIAVNEARISANAQLDGRLISRSGVARLDSARVSLAGCPGGVTPPTATSTSTATSTGTVTVTETVTETTTATGTTGTATATSTATATNTVTATSTATSTATLTPTATQTRTQVPPTATQRRTVTVAPTATATVRRTPTGSTVPGTGGADIIGGGSEDLAVLIGVGVLGVALAAGAGLMLHRRRTY
ncbi:MAG: sortase [Chloroflexi bacterium]|nr:MAG: sortase [Chloroflexota bacterium]